MKSILSLFALILLSCSGWSQTIQQNWETAKQDSNLGLQLVLQYKFHYGGHLYTGTSFNDYLQERCIGNELRFGWQTDGSKDWQKALNYPIYGIGLYSGYIGDPEALGAPHGLYGFLNFPILRRPKHYFLFDLAAGVTYDLVEYNEETNPLNDAIGASMAVYFNLGAGGNFLLNDKWGLSYGLDLTHFSNGRTFTPNYGINMVGVNAGLSYYFNPIRRGIQIVDPSYEPPRRPHYVDRSTIKAPQKYSEINAYLAGGTVMYEVDNGRGPRYGTMSSYISYRRKFNHLSAFDIGFDWMYDGSLYENYVRNGFEAEEGVQFDYMLGGVHAGHALFIDKLSIETQLGVYVVKPQPQEFKGKWYMRVSGRYSIGEHWFAQVGLKTKDGGAADWIEWGLGYRFAKREIE